MLSLNPSVPSPAGFQSRFPMFGSLGVRTAAEIAAGVAPNASLMRKFPEWDPRRYGFAEDASAALNSQALQDCVDVAAQRRGEVLIPGCAAEWEGEVELKDFVSVWGEGSFATQLTCTVAGNRGFWTASVLNGIQIGDMRLVGEGTTDAAANGIEVVGGASSGVPKFVLRNLLVSGWGNTGIYLENGFDALIEACNASSNKAHGMHIVGSFSLGGHKNVTYQNQGHGFYIQRAAGSLFSGTAQENYKNGWRIESARGCKFITYFEQNGWSTATDAEMAQVYVDQTAGGYARSSGVEIHAFGLGGAGSAMESKYGVYVNNARRITLKGSLGGHLDSDIRITSNASHVVCEEVDHQTGLSVDTPTPVNDTSTRNVVVPVRQQYASVPDNGTGNVGAGEDDLFTYTLPGGTLWRNGQGVEIHAWGTTSANANNKRMRLYFGATVIADTGNVAANDDEWSVLVRVYRRGPTVQYAIITASKFNGAPITGVSTFTAPAETLENDVTIKCTGEATADDDVVQRGMTVRGL